jgi:hypothetical protein
MQFQFDVTSIPTPAPANPPMGTTTEELLRQILEVQREHLHHLRNTAAAQDHNSRWKSLLTKWEQEFPGLTEACKQATPIVEKAYWNLLSTMVQELADNGGDALEGDFSLQDFLDRYALRLMHLGHVLNSVGPLAEAAASQKESSS